MMSDHHSNEVEVELRPFKHQVGGHTCVLEVTKSAICKPFIPREAWFYEHEPEELKDFTPKYLGETFVTCDIQDDRKCLVARIPAEILNPGGLSRPEPVHEPVIHSTNNPYPKKRRKRPHRDSRSNLEAWSSTCIDRQINKYGFWANNQPQKFIILENLVYDYEHPCLMDLKMGRRQFGVDSNEEKRKLLENRCACSTSATLGFRISGSQAYKSNSETYTFHDKYFGRDLDTDGAVKELQQFFHNDVELRVDVVRKIVRKLETLQSVLLSQTDLFFHSASLLLIYDGANPKCSPCSECNKGTSLQCDSSKVSVKSSLETDVSSKSSLEAHDRLTSSLPDESSITSSLEDETRFKASLEGDLKPDYKTDVCSKSSLEEMNFKHQVNESSKTSDTTIHSRTSEQESMPICGHCYGSGLGQAKVDVRMIDFAHVSEKFPDEDEIENIADDTIVFGLIKLKEILTRILESSQPI
ncbi:inositol hexakisphosphate kinase 3-like isoform X2 [Mercenaria mercenaria]|nr:inositol hexakisphosphate kinase 3-like isoform X2 [Mercenaria mercenaria]XP_045170583.1 inositol hexakisphosphate kinase 3-like isoform X2 [Mercenaria mercenaria]XP_045170584.1 inositol hexakisphosphate kinase 3-like isoform X2 [Mercenaria mercenaria]XP_045170586.1 inositol hexakisphosphate kinase 3-like isoform X2 [Mercenaria mercenaria]XP_045170588.1 inositol hexakisphosphate kinase 3-like isoform X2 [Mercenaria mercenaria]